jgi:hypothetical protein
VYLVETDKRAQLQIDALPAQALTGYAELRTMLEVSPWSGMPLNRNNPNAEVDQPQPPAVTPRIPVRTV